MQIGSYEVHTIETGEFGLDGGAMFGVVPKALWSKRIHADKRNRIEMRLRCLLLRGEGKNILVDCGMGTKWSVRLADIYKLDYTRHNLEGELKKHGLTATDITDVLLTHLHFDHAGGSTSKDENEKISPAFPKATYYVQRENLEWARNPKEKDKASYMPEDWEPLLKEGVLKVMEDEKEFLPGIQIRRFYGHTRGIQLPFIDDGKTKLFFCGDVIPTSVHLGIPWVMAYDNFPLLTIEEKKAILKSAAEENWILVFEHCPQVAAGLVASREKGFTLAEKVSL